MEVSEQANYCATVVSRETISDVSCMPLMLKSASVSANGVRVGR